MTKKTKDPEKSKTCPFTTQAQLNSYLAGLKNPDNSKWANHSIGGGKSFKESNGEAVMGTLFDTPNPPSIEYKSNPLNDAKYFYDKNQRLLDFFKERIDDKSLLQSEREKAKSAVAKFEKERKKLLKPLIKNKDK